jgi:hypothetical protein
MKSDSRSHTPQQTGSSGSSELRGVLLPKIGSTLPLFLGFGSSIFQCNINELIALNSPLLPTLLKKLGVYATREEFNKSLINSLYIFTHTPTYVNKSVASVAGTSTA